MLIHNPMQLTVIGETSSITPQCGGMKKSTLLSNGMTQITSTKSSSN